MSTILRTLRARTLRAPIRRCSTEPPQPQYQAPSSTAPAAEPAKRSNAHAEFYRSGTGRAVAWNFLVAMATFQVLYWSWLKLETLEVKKEKREEIEGLEQRVKGLVGKK